MRRELLVVGLSHHTAPLGVRERLAVATDVLHDALKRLLESPSFSEGAVLSTCNRVEVYATTEDPGAGVSAAREYLVSRAGQDDISSYLYGYLGYEAVQHTFRVAASLDSMVVGEPQILGQVKQAYAVAESSGTVGTLLGRCFERALAVAKRVRTETGIGEGAVSVSSIAVELASKIFGQLRGRHTLLVGAGKMSEAAAKTLTGQGAQLFVLNRNPERAAKLARSCQGQPVAYERLAPELVAADVAITSTASPRFVITRDLMREVVRARRGRPLFLIDIAVPRDVDPRVGQMDNVFLYDVDDLQRLADKNLAARRQQANLAESIVASEAVAFEDWRRTLDLTPTIVALRSRFRAIVRAEIARSARKLDGSGKQDAQLDAMTDAIVNKLLHRPLTQLKQESDGPNGARLIDAARRLFDLQPEATPDSEQEVEAGTVGDLAPAGSRGGKTS